ncbi:MAG TPA: TIGR02678 family protein [Oxalobacteraceae bacterium]|nr:TIGR02678 family protein [Oxalobacteraceae bacterium]
MTEVRDDVREINSVLAKHRDQERRDALRALLMQPLMSAAHGNFAAVRRHADDLREWFAHATGWILHVERDCARLYKRPADLRDATRGAPHFDRCRYVLFCLACAVLERAEPQITLRALGERLLALAAEPELAERGFSFMLEAQHERRDLVNVCRYLLELGVLHRVAGDEDAFVSRAGDALYDVQRRMLASLLAAVRGPSTWPAGSAPEHLDARLAAMVDEYAPENDEGRRSAMRHHLSRRLLDDPVVYFEDLDAELRAYLQNQRGPLATRLCDASGLLPEQRAEGLALVDESGDLTDTAMPAIGTASHITLLVAEFLAKELADPRRTDPVRAIAESEIAVFIMQSTAEYGRYWSKAAREPGAEKELARDALRRLAMLRLIEWRDAVVRPLPALARFALGAPELKDSETAGGGKTKEQPSLF